MYCNPLRRSGTKCRRILIVEDNPDGREALRMLLSMLGHQVDVAADGVEGVEKALEVHPDVAIIDIGLPRLSGYEVAQQVRAALGPNVRLIACTAYAHQEARQRVKQSGFDAHLIKPVELSELLSWLDAEEAEVPATTANLIPLVAPSGV